MIMKKLKYILSITVIALAMSACKKEGALSDVGNISGLGGDSWVDGPIDQWIHDSLTATYNIGVKYKWDQSEIDLNKTLVPPKEEKVIPVMSSIKKAWIDVYVAEAGALFFKKISPKFFNLVGSPAYENGAVKLGTAEGGRKVVLYNINSFSIKGLPDYKLADTAIVKEMFHVIQHEYAHILDQNVKVPLQFRQSSTSAYTSDWLNVTPQEALNEGFVTQYAISGADDDWAEMVSMMLVQGRSWFNNLVNSINYTGTTANGTTADVARQRLRDKEAAVVAYFDQAWNINFYSLQARSTAAIRSLLF